LGGYYRHFLRETLIIYLSTPCRKKQKKRSLGRGRTLSRGPNGPKVRRGGVGWDCQSVERDHPALGCSGKPNKRQGEKVLKGKQVLLLSVTNAKHLVPPSRPEKKRGNPKHVRTDEAFLERRGNEKLFRGPRQRGECLGFLG